MKVVIMIIFAIIKGSLTQGNMTITPNTDLSIFNQEPADPCTLYQNPPSLSACLATPTIFTGAQCCFLWTVSNGVNTTNCFPTYSSTKRTYSANGINGVFSCQTNLLRISIIIMFLSVFFILLEN